jgi:hypothetical protein
VRAAGLSVNHAERLTRLNELLVELVRSPLPTHFFQTLADHAAGAVPHDYLAVCLVDPEKGGYLVHSLVGLDADAVSSRPFSPYEGLPGRVITTGHAHRIEDVGTAREGVPDLEGVLIASGLRATLAVPIRRGPEVLGALLFAARPPLAYGEDDVHVATLLAAGLSAALETSQAYQTLADERMTMLGVLGSTADAVITMNQSGLVLLAMELCGRCSVSRRTRWKGGRCSRSWTTCRCASCSCSASPASRSCRCPTDASRRRAWCKSSRRSASPWVWRWSFATSPC